MNQIDQDDIRYIVVRKIPEKIYTYDPLSNTHYSYVYFTPFKNNMDKLVVKYEHKYVQHTLFKYSFEDGFNACFDWIDWKGCKHMLKLYIIKHTWKNV